jgi:hypothetical protein
MICIAYYYEYLYRRVTFPPAYLFSRRRALYEFISTLDKLDLPVNTFIRPIIIQLQGRYYTNQFQF